VDGDPEDDYDGWCCGDEYAAEQQQEEEHIRSSWLFTQHIQKQTLPLASSKSLVGCWISHCQRLAAAVASQKDEEKEE